MILKKNINVNKIKIIITHIDRFCKKDLKFEFEFIKDGATSIKTPIK